MHVIINDSMRSIRQRKTQRIPTATMSPRKLPRWLLSELVVSHSMSITRRRMPKRSWRTATDELYSIHSYGILFIRSLYFIFPFYSSLILRVVIFFVFMNDVVKKLWEDRFMIIIMFIKIRVQSSIHHVTFVYMHNITMETKTE